MAGQTFPPCPLCGTTNITFAPGGSVTQIYDNSCSCLGGQPGAGPAPSTPPAGRKDKRLWVAPFAGSILANALGGVLAAILIAIAAFLWAHYFHCGHFPCMRPGPPSPRWPGPGLRGQDASDSW